MKKPIAMSLVLLGVIFLAGCGQQQTSQKQPVTSTPVTQQPIQPNVNQQAEAQITQPTASAPAMPADEIGSLITYKNEILGLEFKYPKGWFVREEKTQYNKRIYIENGIGGENYEMSTFPKGFEQLYIDYRKPSKDTMSYDQITAEMSSLVTRHVNSITKNTISVNSVLIDIYESNNISDEGEQGGRIQSYWQYNGIIYNAENTNATWMNSKNDLRLNQSEIAILKAILSTIKFAK